MFRAFIKMNNLQNENIATLSVLLNQPIWYNRHMHFKNKTFFYKHWVAKNIIYREDLNCIDGKLNENLKNALSQYTQLLKTFLQQRKIKTCKTIIKTQDKSIYFVHRYCICETGVKNSSKKTRA